MKKFRLVGLLSILALSLVIPTAASAESNSIELENNFTQTTETSASDNHLENQPDNEAPVPNDSIPIAPNTTDILEEPTTPSIVEIDLSSEITAFHEKGDPIGAISFQVGIESSLNKKLTNYRFETGEDFIADTVGIHVIKVLADLDEQTTYLITCSYSVQNNVSTLPEPELSYDEKNHVLNGKTLPNHRVEFYKVGLPTGEEIKPINTIADKDGNFSISADNFERGRLMSVVVFSPDGVEFSKGTEFKIPLTDTATSTTESTDNSSTKQSESTTSSTKPKPSDGKGLPKTGEESSVALTVGGILAILGVFGIFLVKKKKANK